MDRRIGLALGIALVVGLAGGLAWWSWSDPQVWTTDPDTQTWLVEHRDAARRELASARGWLDPLRVDPIALRAHGIKGKKKLVELLGVWYRLYRVADEADRPAIRAQLDAIAAITADPTWHDLATVDDATFKEDATSYLRAAYLLDRLGFDTRSYRAEIARIQPRLDAHLASRGPSQQLAFHAYYTAFGLREPFPLASALTGGIVAHRVAAATLGLEDVYGLTHEVFSVYDYGDALDTHPLTPGDVRYLREALPVLVDRYRANVDAVAELVSCLRYVRAVDLPAYRAGLDLVLAGQAADGHWGDYAAERTRRGDWDTTWRLELHTTAVAVDALTIAFHPGWNRAVAPE